MSSGGEGVRQTSGGFGEASESKQWLSAIRSRFVYDAANDGKALGWRACA